MIRFRDKCEEEKKNEKEDSTKGKKGA